MTKELETNLRMTNPKTRKRATHLLAPGTAVERPRGKSRLPNQKARTAKRRVNERAGGFEAINADVDGLLVCRNVVALCIDSKYRVKRFSPGAGKMLGLAASDVGRHVSEVKQLQSDRSLVGDIRTGLATGAPAETDFRCGQECWCIRRTRPYVGRDGRIDGVLVTLTDITRLHRRADEKLAAREALTYSLEKQVQERTQQMRRLMFELARVEDRERRTMATELHDGLGQLLAVANVKLGEIVAQPHDAATDEMLNYVRELVEQANRAARSLIFQISPPVLSELGLVPGLEWLVEEMHRLYGLKVTMHHDGRPLVVDQAWRFRLFRSVRELLLNVVKHAKVNVADLEIHRDGDQLHISVTDAGSGFDVHTLEPAAPEDTFGLMSVRERLTFMGGILEIDSAPGDGTVATITVPIGHERIQRKGSSK